jgi:hypothetical protein
MENELKKFKAYLKVQHSGRTNMFDVPTVCALSHGILTKPDCMDIMTRYEDLEKLYPEAVKEVFGA